MPLIVSRTLAPDDGADDGGDKCALAEIGPALVDGQELGNPVAIDRVDKLHRDGGQADAGREHHEPHLVGPRQEGQDDQRNVEDAPHEAARTDKAPVARICPAEGAPDDLQEARERGERGDEADPAILAA